MSRTEKLRHLVHCQAAIAIGLFTYTIGESIVSQLLAYLMNNFIPSTDSEIINNSAKRIQEYAEEIKKRILLIPILYLMIAVPVVFVYWAVTELLMTDVAYKISNSFAKATSYVVEKFKARFITEFPMALPIVEPPLPSAMEVEIATTAVSPTDSRSSSPDNATIQSFPSDTFTSPQEFGRRLFTGNINMGNASNLSLNSGTMIGSVESTPETASRRIFTDFRGSSLSATSTFMSTPTNDSPGTEQEQIPFYIGGAMPPLLLRKGGIQEIKKDSSPPTFTPLPRGTQFN